MWLLKLMLLVAIPLYSWGQGVPEPNKITSFGTNNTSAIRALLTFSRAQKTAVGIVVNDQRLCTAEVNYSGQGDRASIISGVVAQVPGYTTQRKGEAILVLPSTLPPVTKQFLGLVDQHFEIKENVQTLVAILWMHVRSLLHPDEGTALSVLSSPDEKILEVNANMESVEQILNRIAILSHGVWILRPLPDSIQKIGAETPFLFFSELGSSAPESSNLCAPVATRSNDAPAVERK
jgi:hypothetical protein